METDTLKRFDRLVAILIQLQSKKIVKAQEMANRFQVSLRTIYRDLKTLDNAGVPLFGEAGTGYSLVEGYRLPPVMFTREEAGSFIAAEKLMQQFTDKNLGKYFESAMFKIKSVLRGSEKDWVAALEPKIIIYSPRMTFSETIPNALELLFESLAEKKQVVLNYQSLQADQPGLRHIEPVGLFHENQFWYILGYCHLRKDYRQFRLDRIHGITRSDEPFTRTHGTVEDYRKQKKPYKTVCVKLLADKKIAKYLKYNRHFYGFVTEENKGDQVEMTFHVSEKDEGFARWFLMFADYAEILEPEYLKEKVKNILSRSLHRIEKS